MARGQRLLDALTLAVLLVTPPLATGLAMCFLPATLAACESDGIQHQVSLTAWLMGGLLLLTLNLAASYWALGSSGGRGRQLLVLGRAVLVATAGFALLLRATASGSSFC